MDEKIVSVIIFSFTSLHYTNPLASVHTLTYNIQKFKFWKQEIQPKQENVQCSSIHEDEESTKIKIL